MRISIAPAPSPMPFSGARLFTSSISRALRFTFAVAFALACSAPLGAQLPPAARLVTLDDSVRAFVGEQAPGVAIGIVREGAVVHAAYFGEADLSHHVRIGPESRFNIASNGKQFTAAVILSLVQEGRLSLDASVAQLLPDALPLIGERITVRHLLTHTSGLRDVYDLWSLAGTTWWQSFLNNRNALGMLRKQRALNFAPDSGYLYSNSNYILLTEVVRAVADSSFADVSARRFASWGMLTTDFFTDDTQVIPNRTRPYGDNNGTWQEYPSVAAVHGDGGLFTTLPDQLAWEARLQRTSVSGDEATLERVSQEPVAGASVTGYGYGVEISEYRGLPYVFHDGSTGAYNAKFMRFPSQRVSVVVMSNSGRINVNGLAMQYADAVLGGALASGTAYPGLPSVVGERVDETPWLGDYRASSGTIISLARTDSGLVRRIPGAPETRLLPDTGNVYRYATNADLKLALDRDADGQPQFTIYLPTQAPIVGRRLPPTPAIAASAWLGRYVNEETGAEIVISAVDGEQLVARVGGWSGKAMIVRPDLVFAGSYELEPPIGNSGMIDALLLNGGRVNRVLFERARP